jgi:hypothetical protein
MSVITLFAGAASPLRVETEDQQKIADLSLKARDIHGRELMPFKQDGSKASVLIFLTQDCPISNRYAPEIRRIASDYRGKSIRLFLVFVDPSAGEKQIEKHLQDYGLAEVTAILDREHALVRATGASITPEAAVAGPGGEIFYRGRIDNLYAALGKQRRQVTERDLRNALDAIVKDEKVPAARTQAIGCYIAPLK